ncbi:MAG: AAA family ATPase [Epsilonproteobacteria bacterium]|nr:AAA family ATPase [Campylobacterota bacterium]
MLKWLKKLIKKIKNSKRYKKLLKELNQDLKKISLKQKILLSIVLILFLDLSIFFVSNILNHKKESELQKLLKSSKEIQYFDMNSSAVDEILKADRVFFIVDDNYNVDVLLKENNITKEIKNIPIYSITRNIEKILIEKDVNYQWVEKENRLHNFVILSFISDNIVNIILIALILFMFQTSGMLLNSDKFKVYKPKEIKGSMDDIIGYEDVKEEITHLVNMLKNVNLYAKYGIEDFFNIMFSGTQGTGKTTMAVQIAKELKVPILVTTGNIETGFVGGGAKVIKSIYKKAEELAKENEFNTCIVFIDEAQTLLMKRGQFREKWADDTSNELLTHLEGVKTIHDVRIITIVASNFDESNMKLDEAMSARFKKKIHFRLPNEEEREKLLEHFLQKVENKEENINLKRLSKAFSNTSPRTLQTIVQEASLLAIAKEEKVNDEHLMKAFEVVMIGKSNRKTTKNREKDRRVIAIHEIGHFMADFNQTLAENGGDLQKTKDKMKIIKISSENISRVNALGYVLNESEDILLSSISELEKEIRILYGGVASEELIFGKKNITTGSANDIEKITKILRHLFVETSAYSDSKLKLDDIEPLKEEAYKQMQEKSKKLYKETIDLLIDDIELIEYLATQLIDRWVLSKDEIFQEIQKYKDDIIS